ncbi:hypothetical protein LTR70_003206 [Exophiala xenobiotica]|uniref:Uncharacterized protein n=1 Tax=Lithohypha guttulata TaxID=1690604 RepID=A0ABR0KGM3_9EURO|nr:hypothetical protein LTR24_002851 [Lithohypha guttulata]KAK5323718.1 hypothetical protein LTR70_003206 [Exophiala xenobiotica]
MLMAWLVARNAVLVLILDIIIIMDPSSRPLFVCSDGYRSNGCGPPQKLVFDPSKILAWIYRDEGTP